jgi:competence protein ComEA
MLSSRRDRVDDEVHDRFVRVIGLPEFDGDDDEAGPPPSTRRPPELRSPPDPGPSRVATALGAFDPGRRGVRALAAVALVAVAVAAFFAWRARPQTEPVPAARVDAPNSSAGPSVSPGVVVVAVSGRVQHPGLVRLPAGSRVADAIQAAGGALPDTDLSLVNLARKLVDGELVAVGVAAPAAGGAAPGAAGQAGDTGPLNLNTATAAQFEALPGIGPVLAQHLVDYRTKHGQFKTVDELRQVDGLGASRFNQIKDLVTV